MKLSDMTAPRSEMFLATKNDTGNQKQNSSSQQAPKNGTGDQKQISSRQLANNCFFPTESPVTPCSVIRSILRCM